MKSLLSFITDALLGHKLYACVVLNNTTGEPYITSYIFASRKQAQAHADTIRANTITFRPLDVISFRSRKTFEFINIHNDIKISTSSTHNP